MKEVFLAVTSVISSVILLVLFIGIGWYVVWKFFLSRFRLIRELLGGNAGEEPLTEEKDTRRKSRRD